MAIILNIETSSPVCSVSIAKDGSLIAFKESKENNSHARLLTVLIADLLRENGIAISELDAIAVSAGPGSYTGLRIGVSTAKGFCFALNKPLISIPTLYYLSQKMFQIVRDKNVFYMPVLDARRNDIYTAIFDGMGKEVVATECATINDFLDRKVSSLAQVFMGGNAIDKCKSLFASNNIIYLDDVDCDSRWMVGISENKYVSREFSDTTYYEPLYLKDFLPKTGK